MVAAQSFSRHGPASRSAARRNTAARSSNGVVAHAVLGGHGGVDGGGRVGVLGVGEGAQYGGVAVRLHHVDAFTAAHPVRAADDVRQVDRVGGQLVERGDEPGAFGAARCVFVDRLVDRHRNVGDGVHAVRIPFSARPNRWPIGQHLRRLIVESDKGVFDGGARGGLSLGQLLLALDRTMVTLVEAPRGLDMPVGSVALVDVDDVRLGLAVGAGSADLFFLLGVSDAEAVRLDRAAGPTAAVPAAIFVKEPSPAAVKQAGGARHRGGRRRTARPLGTALQAGQPRVRAPRRPRRPAVRLRHRPVRAGPVDRRPHPRDDQHRGRPVPRAGLFGVQRGGRRTAPADHPRPRRAARASGVDRPVGHLRRAAGQR